MGHHTERELRAIIDTQTEIAVSELDLNARMQLIAERAQELTRSTAGLIELVEGDDMVYAVTTGEAAPYLGTRLKIDSSLSGLCVTEGRVLRSDDTDDDARVDAEACRKVKAASLICVPLVHQGETLGVLKVYSPEAHHFDAGDVETLELLSQIIAAQLSHPSLYELEAHDSRRDGLTALPNRRAFEERLAVEVARSSRYEHPFSLCLLDLDGFKDVNDQLGHAAGDEVLRSVARILDESRLTDDCFRVGGDEFAIVMPETTAKEAAVAAGRIAQQVREAKLGGAAIGVSFGVAGITDADPATLLAAADAKLLAAKERLYGRRKR
ncbi:MAG TPA: sensor domain-containing diguanylate cyclase [Solirubrobacterales bacterium]|jgi:diguanylate cyclase (GGDEF)-like protein